MTSGNGHTGIHSFCYYIILPSSAKRERLADEVIGLNDATSGILNMTSTLLVTLNSTLYPLHILLTFHDYKNLPVHNHTTNKTQVVYLCHEICIISTTTQEDC